MRVKINKNHCTPVCNKCGKKLDLFDRQQRFSIHTKIQYGSVYDGSDVSLNLCCDCFDALINSCKVSPIRSGGDV